ncbi:MAG: flagellin FliC [Candidatus Hydrogenedens sp.]|nr:flagellin FliC [Candidatus Hydrogenedens sp.]
MGLRINTNTAALGAQRQLGRTNEALNRSIEQLSSQLRINRAADDAAGLAIAERFSAFARQSRAEINNLQSGVNASQTAEGGLSVQQDAVSRIRELAVQASNGTLTDDQRAALNAEAQQLIGQIDSVAQDTEFNGQQLLSSDQTISLGAGQGDLTLNESTSSSLGLGGLDLSTQSGAQAALGLADTATQNISDQRANIGAQQNGFASAINQRETAEINAQDAESRIRDLDLARASIEKARNDTLLRGGLAGLIQSNVTPQAALSLLGS